MEQTPIGSSLAIIQKIQTTIDGGARITLDLGQNDSELISKLMKLKLSGDELVFVAFVEHDASR